MFCGTELSLLLSGLQETMVLTQTRPLTLATYQGGTLTKSTLNRFGQKGDKLETTNDPLPLQMILMLLKEQIYSRRRN